MPPRPLLFFRLTLYFFPLKRKIVIKLTTSYTMKKFTLKIQDIRKLGSSPIPAIIATPKIPATVSARLYPIFDATPKVILNSPTISTKKNATG